MSDLPVLAQHHGITVVRDDLLEGGTKVRFLPLLTAGAAEVVFGGPFCGGAPLALSVIGRHTGQRVTLFYAKRNTLHVFQQRALANGARIVQVPFGYMTNVQAKARAYAKKAGALFLPLGFDVPAAQEPLVAVARAVRARVGSPDEVWCATGSGMLARCLGLAFESSQVMAVAVGLRSRHGQQDLPSNVRLLDSGYAFARPGRVRPPFPSAAQYEAKAWEMCTTRHRGSALFWNVAG